MTRIETFENGDVATLAWFRRRSRRRRRALAFGALGLSFFGTVGFWLAATGVVTASVTPPFGSPASGNFADVTALSANVSRTNGGAQLQTGVALAKIALSGSVVTSARISVDWTNVGSAALVLNNSNVQISIGLYHTIHTGNCTTSTPGNVDAPFINLKDTDGTTYCVALDTGATGRSVSATGKLLLASNQVGGYLQPSLASPSSISNCAPLASGATEVATSWCQPANVAPSQPVPSGQRILWVIASIVTPGGIPQGQQPTLTTLNFYVGVGAN